jgi:hypothetical protein
MYVHSSVVVAAELPTVKVDRAAPSGREELPSFLHTQRHPMITIRCEYWVGTVHNTVCMVSPHER